MFYNCSFKIWKRKHTMETQKSVGHYYVLLRFVEINVKLVIPGACYFPSRSFSYSVVCMEKIDNWNKQKLEHLQVDMMGGKKGKVIEVITKIKFEN